jgi:uncharacterized protein
MTMPASDKLLQRIALIAHLIDKAPAGFGRTALMKCLYFLQTVRRVPLGYHFRLYTYGPFDSDVLSDLSLAERLGLVESRLSQFSGGYRYELHGGGAPRGRFEEPHSFPDRYEEDIDWVVRLFGGRSARDLENASTLVFIDRSVAEKGDRITIGELARKVHDVKPHLAMPQIEEEARSLREQGLFAATP